MSDALFDEGSSTTLANHKNAIKEIRASARRRTVNQLHRSRARTYLKKTRRLIASGEVDEAKLVAQQAVSALDRAAQKGITHKNAAARQKSRLMKRLNQAQQ